MNNQNLDNMLDALAKSAFGTNVDTCLIQRVYTSEQTFSIVLRYLINYYDTSEEKINKIRNSFHELPLIQHYIQPLQKEIEELKKEVSKLMVYKNYVDVQKEIHSRLTDTPED